MGAMHAPHPHGEASVHTISSAKRTRRSKKRYGRTQMSPSTSLAAAGVQLRPRPARMAKRK
eukprot:5157767-Lingulodinium_polyedra.AAC.1